MPDTISNVRPKPEDLLPQVRGLYREAAEVGMSLSAFLAENHDDPELRDGLHPFQRLVAAAGIRTASSPADGVYAHTLDAFDRNDDTRALVPEWFSRQWRRAQYGAPRPQVRAEMANTRAIYGSTDFGLNTWGRPYVDDMTPRVTQLAPAIPLSELVAITTSIDSDAYRSFYLTDTAAQNRLVRVAEAAELPRAKLTGGEKTIRLYKYGRALEATYEQMRRQPIDLVAFHISRIAIQAESDKVATVMDVLINGDGNANTAATAYNMTTLDALATPGTLSLKAWLAFKLKFDRSYVMTTALVQEAVALQMMLLNVGSANVPLVSIQAAAGFGGFTPINRGLADNVALGWTSDAPALKIVGFDNRLSIQRLVEIGADIAEADKFITRQTNILTFSETEGYAVFDGEAARVMDVNA